MRRRRFIITVGGAIASWPFVVLAQQPAKVFRIGVLVTTNPVAAKPYYEAFQDELRRLGYEEGRNVAFEYRGAEGRFARFPQLAAELVGRSVDVIFAPGTQQAIAAKAATRTIPIVTLALDLVEMGLAESLARPGANLTGVDMSGGDFVGKALSLLKLMLPNIASLATLGMSDHRAHERIEIAAKAAAQAMGIEFEPVRISRLDELESVFSLLSAQRIGAVLVGTQAHFLVGAKQIAAVALKHRLRLCCFYAETVEAGAFMSYAADLKTGFRHAARYVDKILKGADTATLPIEQVTHFNFTINLKTAKTLGIEIPETILTLADRVVE